MNREEASKAAKERTSVVVDILGKKVIGNIKEYGIASFQLGIGHVDRAVVIVDTKYGEIYSHIKDIHVHDCP